MARVLRSRVAGRHVPIERRVSFFAEENKVSKEVADFALCAKENKPSISNAEAIKKGKKIVQKYEKINKIIEKEKNKAK